MTANGLFWTDTGLSKAVLCLPQSTADSLIIVKHPMGSNTPCSVRCKSSRVNGLVFY